MRVPFKYWVPLGFFVVMVILLLHGLGQDPKQLKSAWLNQRLPSVTAPDLLHATKPKRKMQWDGNGMMVVNVFASWCLSCQIEHPLWMEQKGHRLWHLVGIDYFDPSKAGRAFLKKRGQPYDLVLADPEGKNSIELGVTGVPETFVVDEKGIVRYHHSGPITQSRFKKDILPLLTHDKRAA